MCEVWEGGAGEGVSTTTSERSASCVSIYSIRNAYQVREGVYVHRERQGEVGFMRRKRCVRGRGRRGLWEGVRGGRKRG